MITFYKHGKARGNEFEDVRGHIHNTNLDVFIAR
jgi:hypothetical protein